MQSQFYTRLVKGYVDKTLTKEELAVFFDLLSKGELESYLNEDMDRAIKEKVALKKTGSNWSLLKYAAILLLLGFAGYYFIPGSVKTNEGTLAVLPGYKHAVLRMADGAEILLDTNHREEILTQSGIVLSAKSGEGLVYDLTKLNIAQKENLTKQYSTLETPKGGTYQLMLSDGTKVWLNSASKLKFPLLFSGNTRSVEIEGEVYFEVAHRKMTPFVVKSRDQEIKVLGTVFNINAYANESLVKTTLVEGSIAISTGTVSKVILPGQEAQVGKHTINVKQVDVAQAVAWKNGYFKFDKLTVSEIMRQVERWYDVEVVYDSAFRDELFVGKIQRSAGIAELISIFNEGGLKVTLKDRKLRVTNGK